jgi:crossover junction endodeoxyribonuclease RuvC
MLILGIDPGYTGALAFYNTTTKYIDHLYDMPTYTLKSGKMRINIITLARHISRHKPDFAVIEENQSRPKQGLSSTFNFGYASGLTVGVVAGLFIPHQLVKPQIWKTLMNLSPDKKLSLAKARLMWPSQAELFRRAKDDGRAEASLLAFFGERYVKND